MKLSKGAAFASENRVDHVYKSQARGNDLAKRILIEEIGKVTKMIR